MDRETIKKIRRWYITFSILLGILAPLVFIYLNPSFDPRIHPISHFGILADTKLFFKISIMILSIALFWNGETITRKMIKKNTWKNKLYILLLFASINLFLIGVIPMNWGLWHLLPAFFFFLFYTIFVFLFGIARSMSYVRKGFFSVFVAFLMLLTSLLINLFSSYGVAEIVYIFLIFLWNIIMLSRKKILPSFFR